MKKLLIILLLLALIVPNAFAKYQWPTPDYDALLRNPDSFSGNNSYTVEGTVLGVKEAKYKYEKYKEGSGKTDVIICLQPNVEGATPVYIHYFRKWGEPRVLDGDYVIVTVMGGGLSVYWDYEYPYTDDLPFFWGFNLNVNGEDYP